MSDAALKVRGVGKRYTIGQGAAASTTLREGISRAFGAPLRALIGKPRAEKYFWALQEVGFDVKHGEVLGIIGRNGAGKSTLLKILSRITHPTTGEIEIYGRVGSLLEVGTGFHQELTGRENIFMSGAILGMRRAEILRKFDEIVEFAGVQTFLETPVKRYSSGMYTRLAFAVAAHLEPDILIVDEVLAVGDANFQKKCIGKMEELSSTGRTVLFVSHSMPNIQRLCSRVVLLDGGRVVDDGNPDRVARRYLQSDTGSPAQRIWDQIDSAPGDEVARLHSVRVVDDAGDVIETADTRQPVNVEVKYWNLQTSLRPTVCIWLTNEDGNVIFINCDFSNRAWYASERSLGLVTARCRIPGNFLADGTIFILAAVVTYNPDHVHAIERDAIAFQVVDRSEGDGVRGPFAGHWPGIIRPMLDWSIETTASEAVDSLTKVKRG